MPRRKPRASELDTDAALRKMFPKQVREEMEKTAKESEKKSTKKQSK